MKDEKRFTAQDILNFAKQYCEYGDQLGLSDVINFERERDRQIAIDKFIQEYDNANPPK
jgi:hypothetical protein